jgi:hypothetical protein
MDQGELADIKSRADEIRALLEYVPFIQDLLDHDVPQLIAEVQRLEECLAVAGRCPHGELYEERGCVSCFGDGSEEQRECAECGAQTWHRGGKCLRHDPTAPKPYELLKNELEEFHSKLLVSEGEEGSPGGRCPHGDFYADRSCVRCFGDGTEELEECDQCGAQTWHRGGKCLRHDPTAPKPHDLLKSEVEELRSKVATLEQEWAARIGTAEGQARQIQASRDLMREALEYIKPRLGSFNLGESMAKIDRALSASTGHETASDKNRSG